VGELLADRGRDPPPPLVIAREVRPAPALHSPGHPDRHSPVTSAPSPTLDVALTVGSDVAVDEPPGPRSPRPGRAAGRRGCAPSNRWSTGSLNVGGPVDPTGYAHRIASVAPLGTVCPGSTIKDTRTQPITRRTESWSGSAVRLPAPSR
jgi:hypothetical protein